jgi:omega-6 fatty acid desaturase (delta-12 desaturase)
MMDKHNRQNEGLQEDWINIISKYNTPDPVKSWWQIANSLGAYILIWILMIRSLEVSYWLTLVLSVPAAGFMVRVFIIFHDCGHGSFFRSPLMNKIAGVITGLFVFTPYHRWHRDHKIHHQTVGNLDKRGTGDVTTFTVDEYMKLSRWQKVQYRIYRNPFFLFGVAPVLLFTILHRFPKKYMTWKEHLFVHLSTLAIVASIALVMMIIGWKAFLLVQVPILVIGTSAGVWLFYVQHQYRDVKWTTSDKWDYKTIALEGSSMYKLPGILNWFTGNIGYHHIHHLSPRIPNYNLRRCHLENPMFQKIKPITFFSSLESLYLRLWDEKKQRLVRFSEI